MPDVKLTLDTTEYPLTVVDGTTLTLTLSGPTGPAGLSNLSLLGSNNSWTGTQTFSNSVGFSSGVNFRTGSTFSFDSGIAASFRSALGLGSLATLSDGSTITALNANNISSGTLAAARVATLNQNTTGNAATATAAGGLLSTGGTVVVSSSAAPTTGQVLTATSSAAATWQTPTGGGGSGVVEPTPNTIVKRNGAGSVNATSIILSDGNGFTSTMLSADLTGPRTLTLPDADISIGKSFISTSDVLLANVDMGSGSSLEITSGAVAITNGLTTQGAVSFLGSAISFSALGVTNITFPSGTNNYIFPSGQLIASIAGAETLTNKTISGASNTLTNLNASNISSGTLPSARIADDSLSIAKTSGLQSILDAKASKRQYKTADFTAVAYGRYHITSAGTVVVTNPTGTPVEGDIFDVVIASGSATINGVTYSASRFPIEVIYLSGSWVSPTASITGTLSATTFSGSGSSLTNLNASNLSTGTLSATLIADSSLSIAKTSGLQTALDAKAPLASPTFTGNTIITGSGAASAPTSIVSGSVFSGGTPLTALPKSLIQPAVNLYTSVTGAQSTDIITVVGHAFANGDTVAFSSLTGGSGLFTNSKYFVINVSGNTFQLSLTSGGGAINFTSDITAGTITNYAVWSTSGTMLGVNAGPTFTGDLLNLQTGGVSGFRVSSLGGLSANGITTLSNAISISGRGALRANSDGNFDLINNSSTAANLTLQNISASGTTIVTGASVASTPTSLISGTVFTGGTTLTTLPKSLIQPAVNTYTGVTGVASTDIITVVGHAFVNGDAVGFTAITGGAGSPALAISTLYYIINVSGNTFQLSLTSGGAAINFTTDITAGTITNYGSWNTAGTMLGVNASAGNTGDLINLETGGVSQFKVDYRGAIVHATAFGTNGIWADKPSGQNSIGSVGHSVRVQTGSVSIFSNSTQTATLINNRFLIGTTTDDTLNRLQVTGNTALTGSLTVSGTTTASGGIIYGTFTVGTFPTTTYLEAVVTDALAPTQGTTVVAGGSAKCKVMYNGTAKIVTAVL